MNLLRNILILLLSAVALDAMAQERVIVKPEINYSSEHATYILGGLTVDDVAPYDNDLLRSISELTIGQKIEIPGVEISEVINRYWKQGFFSNVKVLADSIVGDRIYLHIALTPQPRISSLSYSGVKKTEREDIEERLGLQVGSQITPDMVNRAKIIIKRYFEDKGFKNAEVDIKQREDVTGNNKVLVDININKQSRIKVNKIYLTGVDEKQVGKVKRAMKKTRENSFLNLLRSKRFLPEKYEEDKDLMIQKLNAWGYRDALLLSDSVVQVDESHVDVYLNLYQGQKYYLRNISWVGNTVYDSDRLSYTLKMQKGDVYDQEQLQNRLQVDEDAIGNLYYNNGYVFNNIDPVEINIVKHDYKLIKVNIVTLILPPNTKTR